MCAIIDANVAHEVFGANRPEAGQQFFEWINTGIGRLVVGGKLLEELYRSSTNFIRVGQQLQLAGRMTIVNEGTVNARAEELINQGLCESDDEHIIALAQISGARLLYSNDGDLQQDFGNKKLIDKPRGKVYSTRASKSFQASHDGLLKSKNLCQTRK